MTQNLFGKEVNQNLELEKDFQERVSHYARLKGWHIYSVPDSRRASLAGFPDLTMFRHGQLVFAELKREKGRVSDAQKLILAELELIPCAKVYLWRPSDWDDIVLALK
jgi:hypothetical protein